MKVSKIHVSHVDETLFTRNEVTVAEIGHQIKSEGNGAVRTIAKKVLDNFWRNF